jgi:hypothetical protein
MVMEAKSVDNPSLTGASRTRRTTKVRSTTLVPIALAPVVHTDSRALVMDAGEFERFHECMTKPAKPSKAMIEAAKLHRLLVSNR